MLIVRYRTMLTLPGTFDPLVTELENLAETDLTNQMIEEEPAAFVGN